jgi:hypothetical protein
VLDADALMALGCEQFEAEGVSWADRQFPDIMTPTT